MDLLLPGRFLQALAACGAAVAVAACGARSTLSLPVDSSEGGGGSGGSTATDTADTTMDTTDTGTTTETMSTSTTVVEGVCQELTYASPFASLQGGAMQHQRSPRLAYSSDDKSSVTIASSWASANQMDPPQELRHTSLAPWGDFPTAAGLGPTYLVDLDAGGSFAIAPAFDDHFALLFRDFQEPPMGGLRFGDEYVAGKPSDNVMSFLVEDQARTALFLAQVPKGYGYGAILRQGNEREIRGGLVEGGVPSAGFSLGCSEGQTVGDGVAYKNEFIFAFGSGTDPFNGGCQGANPGPANRLQVAVMSAGALLELKDYDKVPDSITDVAVAPHSDGAWVVYSGGLNALRIGRIGPNGDPTGAAFQINVPYQQGSVSAASFQDYLMIGWVEAEPEGASPKVQVFGPSGEPGGSIKVSATGEARGRVALLGSPTGRGALLAWSESAAVGDQIRVTRVDCLGGD